MFWTLLYFERIAAQWGQKLYGFDLNFLNFWSNMVKKYDDRLIVELRVRYVFSTTKFEFKNKKTWSNTIVNVNFHYNVMLYFGLIVE